MIPDVYYSINNEKIYNPYLAFERGATNAYHQFPKFEFMPGVFDLANIEPNESFDQLCDQRAHQLRNKYEYLVLFFSGGTDSLLVYNSFVRNNIHLDHIMCDYVEPAGTGHDRNAAVWLSKNHLDPKTKITIANADKLPPVDFCNADWIYGNQPVGYRYRQIVHDHTSVKNLLASDKEKNIGFIAGYEKPHLILEKHQWYMTFLDKTYAIGPLRQENLEMFFVTPDLPALHIKQCHMLIKFLSKFIKSATVKTFFTNPLEHGIDYMQWARAVGRQGEVVPNNSLHQKSVYNKLSWQFDTSSSDLVPAYRPGMALFHEHMLDNTTNSKNFMKGVNELQTNLLIKKYLINHGILDNLQTPVFGKYNGLYSKPIWLKSVDQSPG